jgi:hypothetical protein
MASTILKIRKFTFSGDVGLSQPQGGKVSYIETEIPEVHFTRGVPNHGPHYGFSRAAVTALLSRLQCADSYKMATKLFSMASVSCRVA